MVALDFCLRTGKLILLRRADVAISGTAITLSRPCSWSPGELLVPLSAMRFRSLWHRAVSSSNFRTGMDWHLQPYSLRRGGATSIHDLLRASFVKQLAHLSNLRAGADVCSGSLLT